jgi:hypothetical protein
VSDKAKKKKKPEPQASTHDESGPHETEDAGLAALSALVRPSTLPPPPADAEDDGKLDLRALAASIPPAAPVEPERVAADDEDEPAAAAPAPVEAKPKPAPKRAAPVEEPREPVASEVAAPARSGGGMWIGIGIGAAIAAGAVFFVMNNREPAPAGSALASAAPTSAQVGTAEPSTREVEPAPTPSEPAAPTADEPAVAEPTAAVEAAPPAEPAAPAPAPAAAPAPTAEEPRNTAPRATAEARPRASNDEPSSAPAPTPAPAAEQAPTGRNARASAEPAAAPAPQRSESIDNLLDQALGGRPNREGTSTQPAARPAQQAAAPAPAAVPANAPETPSQAEVARTLGRLMPQIRQCAGDQVGIAPTTILIRNDGSVATVSVGGSPFGGSPQGACMEGVIRNARFNPFRQTTYRVSYPFSIR